MVVDYLLMSVGVSVLVKFYQKYGFVILMKTVVFKCDVSYILIAHIQSDKQLAKLNPMARNRNVLTQWTQLLYNSWGYCDNLPANLTTDD